MKTYAASRNLLADRRLADNCRSLFSFQLSFKIIYRLSVLPPLFLEESVTKRFIDDCVCLLVHAGSYGGLQGKILNISNFYFFEFFHSPLPP